METELSMTWVETGDKVMQELESRLVLTDLSWDLVTLTVFNLDLSFFSALRLKIWNSEENTKKVQTPTQTAEAELKITSCVWFSTLKQVWINLSVTAVWSQWNTACTAWTVKSRGLTQTLTPHPNPNQVEVSPVRVSMILFKDIHLICW